MDNLLLVLPHKVADPIVPSAVETSQHNGSGVLVANGVVDGVISDEFEMPESPVVADGCQEVVDG